MKFEYGDLYRFLVSAGIVLITLSLVIPWLFLREPLDILISTSDLDALTVESQDLLALKQQQVRLAMTAIPYVSAVLLIVGFISIVYGTLSWSELQKIDDETSQLTLAKKRQDHKAMTSAEKSDKLDRETFEEFDGKGAEVSRETFRESYVSIEKNMFDRISRLAQGTHHVFLDQRVGMRNIDILMTPKKDGEKPVLAKDYIVEIKYRGRAVRYSDLKSAYLQLQDTARDYGVKNGVLANTKLIFIIDNSVWDADSFDLLKAKAYSEFQKSGKNAIIALSTSELSDLSDTELSQRLEM